MFLIITPDEKASLCVNIPLPLLVWACPILHCKHHEGGDCFYLLSISSVQHNAHVTEWGMIKTSSSHQRWSPVLCPLSSWAQCIAFDWTWVMDKADLILVESEPRLGWALLLLPERQGEEQKVNVLPAFPVFIEGCVFNSSARDKLKPYPCSD